LTTSHQVTIYVDVNDQDALFAAAMARAKEDGLEESDAQENLKPDGEVHIGNCLRMLLDPGVSPPGCSIEDSSCD
jgi:hypothetical protein